MTAIIWHVQCVFSYLQRPQVARKISWRRYWLSDTDFLPVYNHKVGISIWTPALSFMPRGQKIDITDHPIAAARKAHPSERTDGWRRGGKEQGERATLLYIFMMKNLNDGISCLWIFPYCLVVVYTYKDAHICTHGTSTSQIPQNYLWLAQSMSRPACHCWRTVIGC